MEKKRNTRETEKHGFCLQQSINIGTTVVINVPYLCWLCQQGKPGAGYTGALFIIVSK